MNHYMIHYIYMYVVSMGCLTIHALLLLAASRARGPALDSSLALTLDSVATSGVQQRVSLALNHLRGAGHPPIGLAGRRS